MGGLRSTDCAERDGSIGLHLIAEKIFDRTIDKVSQGAAADARKGDDWLELSQEAQARERLKGAAGIHADPGS
jgi:hypothetical protein